jgi:hypothetical protein
MQTIPKAFGFEAATRAVPKAGMMSGIFQNAAYFFRKCNKVCSGIVLIYVGENWKIGNFPFFR